MEKQPDILFEVKAGKDGDLGMMTLNRPQVLNALNHNMFMQMNAQLEKWAADKNIKAVVLQAVPGRAFCAGGDIRYAYEKAKAKDPTLPDFFGDEYQLNRRIYHFPKPYIVLMDGITMGGGVGISIHGSHRVATTKYIFAMPETAIGFYPDVGGTYFLPRLPNKIGTFLGLTGTRLKYNDCYELGMLDHIVAGESFPEIVNALLAARLENDADVTELLNDFTIAIEKSAFMAEHQTEIKTCFSKNTVEDIFQTLEHYPSAWCEEVLNSLLLKSPTSLKVTLRQMQTGGDLSFNECMDLEYRLTNHFLHGHDFFEGIRSVIIDKDNDPKWKPSTLENVKAHMVDQYFAKS